jgi:hypothetical protein
MKATLEFDLNDADDIKAHLRCTKATDMAIALLDITSKLRSTLKYQTLDEIEYEIVKKIQEEIRDSLQENGINLDELIN